MFPAGSPAEETLQAAQVSSLIPPARNSTSQNCVPDQRHASTLLERGTGFQSIPLPGHTQPAETAATWKYQPMYVRTGPGTQRHDVIAYCDAGSVITGILDTTIENLELQDRVRYHSKYSRANARYVRWLHNRCAASRKEDGIQQSRYRFLHQVMVAVFGFQRSTHTTIQIGRQLSGPVESVGTIGLEFVFLEEPRVEQAPVIPDEQWQRREMPVLRTKNKIAPNHVLDFDILIGTNEGVFEEDWFKDMKRRKRHFDDLS